MSSVADLDEGYCLYGHTSLVVKRKWTKAKGGRIYFCVFGSEKGTDLFTRWLWLLINKFVPLFVSIHAVYCLNW